MLRPALTLAAMGVLGLALWKILSLVLFPLLGLLLPLLKIALVVALVWFALWLFKNKKKPGDDEATAE